MGGEIGVVVSDAGLEDVLLRLRGKKVGKVVVFLLWMAFSRVRGTSEVIASLIEAPVHLFDGVTTISFLFLFLFSLARGMSSSESSLGIWKVGVDDPGKLWGGVGAMAGSIRLTIMDG